ncbi:MAG: carbohydrate binding family 9 domain-containing protein [Acidobacteria bacterium]|nr:carbohydrate binding family 9 domain-containing protein [Acidobacteriota bacterium]
MNKILAVVVLFFLSAYSAYSQLDAPKTDKEQGNSAIEKSEAENGSKISDHTQKARSSAPDVPGEKTRPVTIPKIGFERQILIDGNLDEEDWASAAVFRDFIQTSPGNNTKPSKKTEAFMMYDDKNLYIAFKCWDDRDQIRATVAKRDSVFGEDNVRVFLDTFDDQRRAYVLGWNPLGIQMDGIFTEGRGSDFSVDIVMESKGVIHDWGWSVEVKIPFKSLRYQAGKGKNWGFNVGRNIDRFNDEFDSWMPEDRNVSGFLIKHGKITGLDDIKTERTLELIPSVTVSETGGRVAANEIAAGRFVNQPIKQEYGLNLKYTITPNITLDAAINPDFAEIEADAPVVTANQRFPIFFDEKRPFFLEGADIFQTPIRAFYSRTIVDPDFAAKLTGKIGKNSFGFLVASDNAPGNFDSDSRIDPEVRPYIDEFVDRNALFAVLRLKRDMGKENSIGFLGTARVFPENRNFVGGFDGRFKINAKDVFNFQVIGSHSKKCFFDPGFDDIRNPLMAQRNGAVCGGAVVNGQQELGDIYSTYRTGNGLAYFANYDHSGDTFGYTLEAGGQSSDYRSDAGFNRRTNNNYVFAGFRKSTKSRPDAFIVRANWFNGINASYDWAGRFISAEWNSNVGINLRKNTHFEVWGGVAKERIYEEEFGLRRLDNRSGAFYGDPTRDTTNKWIGGYFGKQFGKRISFDINMNYNWGAYDFDFGAGQRFPRVSPAALQDPDAPLDPGPGKRLNFGTGVSFTPTDPLSISISYNKSRLTRNDTGEMAYDSNIYSLRSTYQFTRFLFTRVRMDYNTLSSSLNGQYLFGWNPNPGTAFYLGYNANSSYNGFNPFTGQLEPGFEQNSRTFFIRMSYLFRKSF